MGKFRYPQRNASYTTRQRARKDRNMDAHQPLPRHQFEHCTFPVLFYSNGDAVINSCVAGGGKHLYNIYSGLSYEARPYTGYRDFDVTPHRYNIANDGSDILVVRLSLPKATEVTECRNIYLCKNNVTGDLMYITSELSAQGTFYLCGWTRKHDHLLFTMDEEPDEFKAAAERFWECAGFEPSEGPMPGYDMIPATL